MTCQCTAPLRSDTIAAGTRQAAALDAAVGGLQVPRITCSGLKGFLGEATTAQEDVAAGALRSRSTEANAVTSFTEQEVGWIGVGDGICLCVVPYNQRTSHCVMMIAFSFNSHPGGARHSAFPPGCKSKQHSKKLYDVPYQ